MSKITPINLRDINWYRNYATSGADNSRTDTGFEIRWASNCFSEMSSYGTWGYSDLVWIAIL